MDLEIERKFLVLNEDFRKLATHKKKITQGYLNSSKVRAVRVRIAEDKAFLTVKGESNETGLSRFEWEKEIEMHAAKNLLPLCEPSLLEKIRHYVPVGNHLFEVDEFLGDNKGLLIAEIELSDEEEAFSMPDWIGREVTGDAEYYNVSLVKKPFKDWS